MKKNFNCHFFIFLLCLWVSLSFISEVEAGPVNIPDPGLRRALESALGKDAGETITETEMAGDWFKIFVAKERNISDLTGIEYATNLQYVYFERNSISDISPLSDLPGLKHLHLEHNQITDISPLSTLTGLQSLNISYNKLTSLDGLPSLSLVYALFVQHNQITNIKPLIDDTEFTCVDNPGRTNLNLEGNPLDDDSVDVYLPTLLFDRDISVKFTTTYSYKVSGDNQTANTHTRLQPFVVEVVNFRNDKLSGVDVVFELTFGSGNFVEGTQKNGHEVFITTTDSDGKASAILTTGSTTGTYRISVQVRVRHPRYIFGVYTAPFTVTVLEPALPPLTLKEESQRLHEYPNQEPPQEEPPQEEDSTETQQQEELPHQEEDSTETQQQEELSQQDEDTTETQQQEELPPQEEDTTETQQQEELPPQEEDTIQTRQQEELPPQEEDITETRQQEELPPQEEDTIETQQQEELSQQDEDTTLELEPNYTKMPFDYEKEWVGKVVFSELMLSQKNQYPQWIELYNTTDQEVDLYGWKIVGRYLDISNLGKELKSQVISKSFVINRKEAVLIVGFTDTNSKDRMSDGLEDKIFGLNTGFDNFCNYNGLVLELQDADGNPIDRIGNLNEEDEIVWEIPQIVRNNRISLIRRLKTIRSHEYNFSFGVKKFGWFSAEKVKHLIGEKAKHYYGRSSDIGTPGYRTESGEFLPVVLSSFRAHINENGETMLSWNTESEIDNAGFNILRSQFKQGPFVKVNSKLIQGAGTTGKRSSYRWTDTTTKPRVEYFYQIEDVSFAGNRQTLSTIRLKGLISAKNRFTTQWGHLKSRQ